MKDFSHIKKFEDILDSHIENLESLNESLDAMELKISKYESLVEYYFSDQRNSDLESDERGEITQKRGILSEDAIYNMMVDYRETALKMLEIATKMLRA